MALRIEGLYWQVSDITINRKMKVAKVIVKGYKTKADCDGNKLQAQTKEVTLQGGFFPFVNGLTDKDQISNVYTQIKLKENFFKDAIDV